MASIKDLIEILKTKDEKLEVEFVVVEKDTSLVCMDLTSDVCDQEKMFKSFRSPAKHRVTR